QPRDAKALELERDLHRGPEAPLAMTAQSREDAGLVGVDQDHQAATELAAYRLDHADVIACVIGAEAKLDRPEAVGQDAAAVFDAALRAPDLAGRAASRHTTRHRTPHLVDRTPADPAG